MRDAESLVQVEMRDIRSVLTRTAEPDLSVHVSTVQVYLHTLSILHKTPQLNMFNFNGFGGWHLMEPIQNKCKNKNDT
jgi:hypothetical protein